MITITKNNIYFSNFSLRNTKANCEEVEEIKLPDLLKYIGEDVELGEDMDFQRIFDIIIYHKDSLNILYHQDLDGILIDDFIFDYENENNDFSDGKSDYLLRICWSGVLYNVNGALQLFDFPIIEGFGVVDSENDEYEYPISISFVPLNNLKHKKLVIYYNFEISTSELESGNNIYIDYRPIKLFDLFSSILREITQFGTPKERDEARIENELDGERLSSWLKNPDEENFIDSDNLPENISDMISREVAKEGEKTFWEMLYPESQKNSTMSQEELNFKIEQLERELKDSVELDNYERAAEISKILNKIKP